RVTPDAWAKVHQRLVNSDAHGRRIGLHSASSEYLENLFDSRFVADWRKRIIPLARRLGRILSGFAMNLIQLLSLIVIRFKVCILKRPFRGESVLVPELFKIPFAKPKQRRAINFGVAADVITESGMNLATSLVVHRL